MIKKELEVKHQTGLHARPAAYFIETAEKFESDINLTFDGVTINAKSIIGILSLGIGRGDLITLSIEGEDEQEAMEALSKIINNKFE